MYEFRDPYIVDFSEIENYFDFHRVIEKAFDFPDYYGANWSALWDCLTDLLGNKINIEIYGLSVVEEKLGNEISEKFLEIMSDFKLDDSDHSDNISVTVIEGGKKRIIS